MTEKKNKGGRPSFEPTDEQRRMVETLSGCGIKQDQMAILLEIDAKTLRKHFETELATGKTKVVAQVAQSLVRQALGAPAEYDGDGQKVRDEVKPNPASQFFYLKCQAGWKETSKVELGGEDGGPANIVMTIVDPKVKG